MMKEKLIKLKMALAAVLFGLTLGMAYPLVNTISMTVDSPEVVEINKEINENTGKEIIENINKVKGDNIILDLNTPGGDVEVGSKIEKALEGKKITSIVRHFSASLGAHLLMLGDNRVVDKDASVLFHGAHQGNIYFTQYGFGRMLEILENNSELSNLLSNSASAKNFDKTAVEKSIESLLEVDAVVSSPTKERLIVDAAYDEELKVVLKLIIMKFGLPTTHAAISNSYRIIRNVNHKMTRLMVEKLQSNNITMTDEEVERVFFNNFRSDVILSGEELLKMGAINSTDVSRY